MFVNNWWSISLVEIGVWKCFLYRTSILTYITISSSFLKNENFHMRWVLYLCLSWSYLTSLIWDLRLIINEILKSKFLLKFYLIQKATDQIAKDNANLQILFPKLIALNLMLTSNYRKRHSVYFTMHYQWSIFSLSCFSANYSTFWLTFLETLLQNNSGELFTFNHINIHFQLFVMCY